jgi:Uma2 family endonuclease
MAVIVHDPLIEADLKRQRAASGADRFDEVWNGVYFVSPQPNDEHQDLVTELIVALHAVIVDAALGKVRPSVNVSDRDQDWTDNYRCPDVAVFLDGTKALNRGSHWLGGPDFAIEILSPGDRAREKLEFYASVGVRELLIIDRDPWGLELYRLDGNRLGLVGRIDVGAAVALRSEVIPLFFGIVPGEERPSIVASHQDGREWQI